VFAEISDRSFPYSRITRAEWTIAMAKDRRMNDDTAATMGYEADLWRMAEALRGSMDAAEFKQVVLGLIFLKYISDAFEAQHAILEAEQAEGADPEDPDEYRALNIFWVPPEARWWHLKAQAPQFSIGQLAEDSLARIERDNPSLKGVLPKDYARPALAFSWSGRPDPYDPRSVTAAPSSASVVMALAHRFFATFRFWG
jgi:hypothetical protein